MVSDQERQRALTQKQTLLGRVAHFSEVTALSLSASHSFVMPSAVYVPLRYLLMPHSSFSAKLSASQRSSS